MLRMSPRKVNATSQFGHLPISRIVGMWDLPPGAIRATFR